MESGPRIDLLMPRAKAPFVAQVLGPDVTECGLVFRGVVSGKMSAVVLKATGSFDRDDSGATITDAALRAYASTAG